MNFNDVVTPQQRAQAVRNVLTTRKPGDTVTLPAGGYDFEDNGPTFPEDVTVRGEAKHPDDTILQCAEVWQQTQSTAFVLSDGTTLANLTLQSTCPINRQSCVVGFGVNSDKPRHADLCGVRVLGRAWGVYLWNGEGDSLIIADTYIEAANVGVCLGRSSGASAQYVVLDDVFIKIDPSLSTQGGSTTNPVDGGSIGVVVRGGTLKVFGLKTDIVGQAEGRGPMCCSIADHLEGGSRHAVIYVHDLISKLTPGAGTTICTDIDNQLGTVLLGGTGSGEHGELTVRRAGRQ